MHNIINTIHKETEIRMSKCIDIYIKCINTIRTHRISPDLLNDIQIEYLHTTQSLRSLSNVTLEDSRTLAINVFDSKLIPIIEKKIKLSNLDLSISTFDKKIKVALPIPTEERRRNLIKFIHTEAEHGRISLRNIRRDTNDQIKKLLKNKTINKDEEHRSQDNIQKLTDFWIKKIDSIMMAKESELMKI